MIPLTVTLNGAAFVELFESLSEANRSVISIHLSSDISGTFAGAVQADKMVEGLDIRVFDSEVSCYMQGFYTIRAAKLANVNFTIGHIGPVIRTHLGEGAMGLGWVNRRTS